MLVEIYVLSLVFALLLVGSRALMGVWSRFWLGFALSFALVGLLADAFLDLKPLVTLSCALGVGIVSGVFARRSC